MGSHRKPARIVNWKSSPRALARPFLFWTDYTTLPPTRKRHLCEALGAHTEEQRRDLVRKYRLVEKMAEAESLRRGGAAAYESLLEHCVRDYLRDTDARVKAREESGGTRVGLARTSGKKIRETMNLLLAWLHHKGLQGLTTGQLSPRHFKECIEWLARTETKRGTRPVLRSPHTLNQYVRNMKTLVSYLADLRPPVLPDPELLRRGLKPVPADPPEPRVFTPEQLVKFRDTCRAVAPRAEKFFEFVALTGCRVGEAAGLLWDDIDTEKGRITFRAAKTGRRRTFPLVGAPEGDVAPGLLTWLKAEKEQAWHKRLFRFFPRKSWENAARVAGLSITPQDLRTNFASYACAMGIPATTCALWQGHGLAVAERFYRAQVLDRKISVTLAGAMGLEVSDSPITDGSVAP